MDAINLGSGFNWPVVIVPVINLEPHSQFASGPTLKNVQDIMLKREGESNVIV